MDHNNEISNSNEKDSNLLFRIVIISLTIIGIVSLLLIVISMANHYTLALSKESSIDVSSTAALGAILSGIVSPIVSLIAVILYVQALKLQRNDLELQRQELVETRKIHEQNVTEFKKTSEALDIQSKYTMQQEWKNEFYIILNHFKDTITIETKLFDFNNDRGLITIKYINKGSISSWVEKLIQLENVFPVKGAWRGSTLGMVNIIDQPYHDFTDCMEKNSSLKNAYVESSRNLVKVISAFDLLYEHLRFALNDKYKSSLYLIMTSRVLSIELLEKIVYEKKYNDDDIIINHIREFIPMHYNKKHMYN